MPRFTHHLHITARGMGRRHQRLAGKSGGRLLRWRRPCVPWRVRPAHRHAQAGGRRQDLPRPPMLFTMAICLGPAGDASARNDSGLRRRRCSPRAFGFGFGVVLYFSQPGFVFCGTTVMDLPARARPAGFSLQGSRAPNQYNGFDVTDVLSPSWRGVDTAFPSHFVMVA